MPRYIVEVPAVYIRRCTVHAASEEEARIEAEEGNGSWGQPEYDYELPRDKREWKVFLDVTFDPTPRIRALVARWQDEASALERTALVVAVKEERIVLLSSATELRKQAANVLAALDPIQQ